MDTTKDKIYVEAKIMCNSTDMAKKVRKFLVSTFGKSNEKFKVWTDRKTCRIRVEAYDILTASESPIDKMKTKLLMALKDNENMSFMANDEVNRIFVWIAWEIWDI